MEAWYDAWLRGVGTAVVAAPGTSGGMIDDVSVGDMSPPARVPCRRIASRLTILCDGSVVSCEEDLAARRPMGHALRDGVAAVWQSAFGRLRTLHADRRWGECETCAGCREWHRP
jgi:radical SAM protein with 4Fe4S-binding SPASM domain